jgi:hypothetical protein
VVAVVEAPLCASAWSRCTGQKPAARQREPRQRERRLSCRPISRMVPFLASCAQRRTRRIRVLPKMPENRRDLPGHAAQARVSFAQRKIQFLVRRGRLQHLLHQRPIFYEPLTIRMPLIQPMPQQPLPHHRIAPKAATILQTRKIVIHRVGSPDCPKLLWRSAHQAYYTNLILRAQDSWMRSRGSFRFLFGTSKSSGFGTMTFNSAYCLVLA